MMLVPSLNWRNQKETRSGKQKKKRSIVERCRDVTTVIEKEYLDRVTGNVSPTRYALMETPLEHSLNKKSLSSTMLCKAIANGIRKPWLLKKTIRRISGASSLGKPHESWKYSACMSTQRILASEREETMRGGSIPGIVWFVVSIGKSSVPKSNKQQGN